MLSAEKKEALLHLLTNTQALIQNNVEVVSDYQSLKTRVAEQELDETITEILSQLTNNADDFPETFRVLCEKRAFLLGTKTCLSLFAMPNSACNELYWQIASLLFEPETLGEMFTLLLPNLTTLLVPELYLDVTEQSDAWQLKEAGKSPALRFKETPLSEIKEPAKLEALKRFIAADCFILDVSSLATLSFDLHETFYKALQSKYQVLAEKLYEHNKALKTLASHLQVAANQGEPPYIVIKRFMQELRLGGQKMTGRVYASMEAHLSCQEFIRYLEALPSTSKEVILNLKTIDGLKSFNAVLVHLEEGNCVEQAAGYLQSILDNKENQNILKTKPYFSVEQIELIKKQYSHGYQLISLTLEGHDQTTQLPEIYLEKILTRIVIDNAYSYLSLLLSFPPSLYDSLLNHVQINCRPPLDAGLGKMIANAVFNSEQVQALNQAILNNYSKLGGLGAVIRFAATHNNLQLLEYALTIVSASQFLAEVKEKDNDGFHALHNAAPNPEFLCFILERYPEEERLGVVKMKTNGQYNTLHLAAATPESLRILLQLYPESARIAAITETTPNGSLLSWTATHNIEAFRTLLEFVPAGKFLDLILAASPSTNNYTFLYSLVSNPEVLAILLKCLNESELITVLKKTDQSGHTLLRFAAEKNPNSLQLILQLFSENVRGKVVKIEPCFLSWAAISKQDSFRIVWDLLPVTERLAFARKSSKAGNTIFHRMINQDKFISEILTSLPENECFVILNKKNKLDLSALHLAVAHPKSLLVLLKFYPINAYIVALKEKSKGANVLAVTIENHPESLGILLRALPHDERLALVTEQAQKGYSILGHAAKYPESLRAILLSFDNEKIWQAYQQLETGYNNHKQQVIRHLKRFVSGEKHSQLLQGPGYFPGSQSKTVPFCLRFLMSLKVEERSLIALLFLIIKHIPYAEAEASCSEKPQKGG